MMISHHAAIQHLLGSQSTKEGGMRVKQLMFFALLWVLITTGIATLGWDNFSSTRPSSWLMVLLPSMGLYLFILAIQCQYYLNSMGKASIYLAKASFQCGDNIQGYVEFKDLKWHGDTSSVAHISLKNKQDPNNTKEEWITKANTQVAPRNKGIRVSFNSLVRPTLEQAPSPEIYTWCLHISLEHNNENYRKHFEIPMGEIKKS